MLSPEIEGLTKTMHRNGMVAKYSIAEGSREWVTVYSGKAVLFRNAPGFEGGVVSEVNHQGTTESVISVVKLLLGVA